MDFGKWKYEQEQRRKESRKRATNVVIKEMKFRPKIDGHDYTTKMKHVERFLGEGNEGQAHDHVPGTRDGPPGARAEDPRAGRRDGRPSSRRSSRHPARTAAT